MSRIGKLPVQIPSSIQVEIKDGVVTLKNSSNSLSQEIKTDLVTVKFDAENNKIVLERKDDSKEAKSFQGLYRSLIANMAEGLDKGFKKTLEIHGVGYRVNITGNKLDLSLGFSHPVVYNVPKEIKVSTDKGKVPVIILESHDKQLLGQVAAEIRSIRKPEPYKGKGVRYSDEVVRRKAGKTAGKD